MLLIYKYNQFTGKIFEDEQLEIGIHEYMLSLSLASGREVRENYHSSRHCIVSIDKW